MTTDAQVLQEFNMTDTVVTLCKGILLDSEDGPGGNIYSNNEDYTFTIDAGGPVTLVFDEVFCTEQGLDLLTFHDGPSILSPQIGPAYSGIVAPPPITSTSYYLTVHFVTDANVAYCGFEAQWTSVVIPPVPPVMTVPTAPLCSANTIDLAFSYPIPCDSINPDAFVISGSNNPAVTSAIPTNCIGGETQTMQLGIDPTFDRNCPYDIAFTIGIRDRCDSLWYFTISANTQIATCPLGVLMELTEDTICAGSCTELFADVQGCLTYAFAWNNGLPNSAGPHTVCPNVTTTYTVTVTESGTGQTATGSITVVVFDLQVSGPTGAICQSDPAFNLGATPPGGTWSGAGIVDSLAGTLDPDTAGPGVHTITYSLGGCSEDLIVTIDSMDAGVTHAACPGTAPFFIPYATPTGGIWTGTNVQSNGLFDPNAIGSYLLTYTAGNCSDTVTVNVDNIVGQSQLDTVCQSTYPFNIPVSPFGGRWSGPGIVDTLYGTFDPDEAGGGLHTLLYDMHGCDMSFTIYVKAIDIGDDRSACPSQAPFVLTPAAIPPGGAWSGLGIADASTGSYDPMQAGLVWDVVTYAAPNACVDTIGILVGWTQVNDDTLFFCEGDGALILDESTTGRTPWDGIWTGAGIAQDNDGNYFFDPALAGVGEHLLHFDANTCGDSMLAIVHPATLGVPDMIVCSATGPFLLAAVPAGATFTGDGVTSTGVFDPAQAGAGPHAIVYDAPAGCSDTINIDVYPFQQAIITGVQDTYCSNDVLVSVQLFPAGGVFTGLPDTLFNPSLLTDGIYELVYSVGFGQCLSSDTLVFTDYGALSTQVLVSNNPICGDGGSVIEVVPSGGNPNYPVSYQWSDGAFPIETNNVSPDSTTLYIVTTTDGCSDPVIDSVLITVHPPFQEEFAFSAMQCYGEPGYVSGSVIGTGTFTFSWDTGSLQTGDSVNLPAGELVQVHVENDATGCSHDTLIQVPSWPAITALFSANPDEPCVPWDQRDVTFIDLSNNAVGGYWVIDGDTVPYSVGGDPNYDLGHAGYYSVQLVVWNQGNCTDSMSLDICIEDSEAIFLPDAFSPNGDGSNDVLYVRGGTIAGMEFAVYDRWGARVFSSTQREHGWDGNTNDAQSPSGVYLYTLQATLDNGDVIERTGNITLVR
ncbi:MAG: gliding motility-associated C-terminal domain-containing protein [Flavobacteriales bacterium]